MTGEAGSIGAPAAVVSAALDALVGVTDLHMPLTSEQVWRRIGEAGVMARGPTAHNTRRRMPRVLHLTRRSASAC